MPEDDVPALNVSPDVQASDVFQHLAQIGHGQGVFTPDVDASKK